MTLPASPAVPPAGRLSFVTALFTDLCGSTRLAARLEADVYADMLAGLREAAAAIVRANGGEVSQLYGDGMLAVFTQAGGAGEAIAAALAIHEAAASLPVPRAAGVSRLAMHSGIHAGLVLLRPGDLERGRIETIGRSTAIAARLSAAARADELLVSAGTLGPLDRALALGAARPVPLGDGEDAVVAVPVRRSAGATAAPRGHRSPFVGRADIAGRILGHFLPAPRAPVCVAVVGPPGQGKSRLADEIAAAVGAAGLLVLRGAASASASAATLQPFREIDAGAGLLLADAAAPPASEEDGPADPMIARLARLVAERPTLLVIDDWQWADGASAQMLARLRRLAVPLAILLLSRSAAPGDLPIGADVALDLPPLGLVAAAALIRTRRPELDATDARRVHRLAGGKPLYLEELCQLSVKSLRGPIEARPRSDEIGWLSSLIAGRLAQLPDPLMRIVNAAAVIGEVAPRWLLDRLCAGLSNDAAIARLEERDLLTATHPDGSVRFLHGVTWGVVTRMIKSDERRLLHARLAEIIETHVATPIVDRDEQLAWHYLESEQFGPAVPCAERAGDLAAKAGAVDRAQFHYERALRAIDTLSEAEGYAARMRLIGKFGLACVFDSDAGQLAIFDRATAVAAARRDAWGEALARFWSGFVCHGIGLARRAVTELERSECLAGKPEEPSAFHAQIRATLGQALAAAGRYAEATPLLDEAIAIKRRHRSGRNASVGMAYSLALKGAVEGDTGDFPAARASFDEARAVLDGRNDPAEASVSGWDCAVRAWRGDWEGLVEAAARGCEVALRIETVYIHAICRAFGGYARWRLDGSDAAAATLIEAVACMDGRGKRLALSIAYGFLADVHAARGERALTRRAVARAFERARAGEPFGIAWAARAWARLIAPDDPARARRSLARARANAEARGSPHEYARCDYETARLALVAPADRAIAAARAAAAFARMGMARDAEAALLLNVPTVRSSSAPPPA